MGKSGKFWLMAGGAVALAGALLLPGTGIFAADHLDPPARTDAAVDQTPDFAADIDDVFAWHSGNTIKIILTFAGPFATNLPGYYDRDVLYKININTAAPEDTPEIVIKARFGRGKGPNEWGIQVEGLPGVTGNIEGPVETVLQKDGVTLRAGLYDEPFFFDLQGFRESRSTGTIRFNNKRNFFDAQNDQAIVIEIPKDRFNGATMPLGIWATTARIGGQL